MMKTKLLLVLLVAVGLAAGTAQANMLLNPGFEDGAFETNDTPDYWAHYYTSFSPIHTWIDDSDEAHLGGKFMKMPNWYSGITSAWLGQDVAGVVGGSNYAFAVWAKNDAKNKTNQAGVFVEWSSAAGWVGSDTAEVEVTSDDWTHITFGTFTAPEGAIAAKFWLVAPMINLQRPICYDDAVMVCIDDISPEYSGVVPPGDAELSWTNLAPDPNDPDDPNLANPVTSVWVDVWFGTNPDKLTSDPLEYEKIVDAGQDTTSVTVDASVEGAYYWQVDSYIYGNPAEVDYNMDPSDPNSDPNRPHVIEKYFFKFYATTDAPPSVDAGVDMITWSDQPVQLDPTVVDDGQSTLTYLWRASDPNAVFNPNKFVLAPTVTISKIPGSVPIVNAGFEDPEYDDGGWDNIHPGWDTFSEDGGGGDIGIWNPNATGGYGAFDGIAPESQNIGWTYNETAGGLWGFAQELAATFAANTNYTLSVYVGNFPYYAFVGYKVQLLAGENLLAEDDTSIIIPDDTFEFSTVTLTSGGASDPNFAYVGLPLQIRLLSKPGEACWDDVQLITDPPLPSLGAIPVLLTLAVSDGSIVPHSGEDTMTIDVYDDACAAARIGLGLMEDYPADIVSEYCITDLPDLVEFVKSWLDSTELTAPEVKGPDPGAGGDVIGNAGFEEPPQEPGQYNSSCFNPPSAYHWTKIGNYAGVWDPGTDWSAYGDETPEGENCAYVEEGSGITQVLTETLKAETDYTLRVQVGNNDYYNGGTYTIELLAGETSLVSFSEDIEDIEDDTFELRTLVYEHNPEHTALIGEPLEITIALSTGGDFEADFDDVRLDIVPVNPNLPSVNAGDSWITWSGQEVQLDPTVVNNDTADPQRSLSYLWSADDDTGVVFSPSATVEAPTVTITKATANPSAVKLTLAVTLEGEGTVTDSMAIDVYDDACKATTGAGYEYAVTDFNGNCITDLGDFAILAKTWLVDYDTLTEPVEKPAE